METGGWTRLEELFHQAADLVPAERAAFLSQVCGNDEELRRELESLLAADTPQARILQTEAVRQFQASPNEDESELIGARIGRYTITDEIGRGGMGAVYGAVRDDDFHKKVAIKLLKRGTDTEAALRRFRIERQILAGLQHPNIACLLDGGATGSGLPYFVMEYVDGTPLLEYAAPLSVRERLELFRAVCSAVGYAHRNQVVHRDIKPANILVNKEGVPKLLDFGIARLLDPAEQGPLTLTGMRLMTPAYASPEQVRGETVSEATDIYSLGAVLYELLTNRRAHPVENRSPAEIESEICTREPERPSAVNRDLDPDLDNIVLMALRTEPARRYGSVEQLSADLDRFLHDQPVLAREETLGYRSRKFLKRNRVSVTAATLSAALVLAFTLALAGLGRVNRPAAGTESGARSIAVLPLENLSGDPAQEYFSDGLTEALTDDLSRVPGLRVISRTSSSSFKGAHRPLPEIARALGVQTVTEGSVLRTGSRVRLAVRLVDAAHDRPIWSDSYEGELSDVLALQNRVTSAIAGEIGVKLNAQKETSVPRPGRVDVAAYDAYLKGRRALFQASVDDLQQSIRSFDKALEIDPSYALAYTGLAESYLGLSGLYLRPREAMAKAEGAATRALEIDPNLAAAHVSMGVVRGWYDFAWAKAEEEFKRAIDLNPNDATARLYYGMSLVSLGRPQEGIRQVKLAHDLDPLSSFVETGLGQMYFLTGQYQSAIQQLRNVTASDPDFVHGHMFLGAAYLYTRQYREAIPELEEAMRSDPRQPQSMAYLAYAHARLGDSRTAARYLEQLTDLRRTQYVSGYLFAIASAGMQTADALQWLQMAYEDRDDMMAWLNVDALLDPLRGDPRFKTLVHQTGLGFGAWSDKGAQP